MRKHACTTRRAKPVPQALVIENAQDRVVGYEPQRRVEPKVSFVFNF